MEYIFDLLAKLFQPWLDSFWASLSVWRTLSLLLITVLVVSLLRKEHIRGFLLKKEYVEHDKIIFVAGNTIAGERLITNICERLDNGHEYMNEEVHQLQLLGDHLSQIDNRFQHLALRKHAKRLVEAIWNLNSYLGYHFWHYPNDQNVRQKLHPNWNIDYEPEATMENRTQYGIEAEKLAELVQKLRRAFRNYRECVKDKLNV